MKINELFKLKSLGEQEKKSNESKLNAYLKFQNIFAINDITLIPGVAVKVKYKGEIQDLNSINLDFVKLLYPIYVTVEEDDEKYEEQYAILEKKVEYYSKVAEEMKKKQTKDFFHYILSETLNNSQQKCLFNKGQIDYSINLKESNFRLNISFFDEGIDINPFVSIRKINKKPYTLKEMNVNKLMLQHFKSGSGLILISGPTGSAKSSTLTSILDYYNNHENKKIITLEDPIEFFWEKEMWKKSIILQREIGKDVESFTDGLKAALRANPDIVIVGELRDKESVEMAIETAGTGHLVIATVHVKSTYEVLDRILGFFDKDKTKEIASKLSGTLNFVMNQRLISTDDGYKVAYEYLNTQYGGLPSLIKEMNLKDVKGKMRELDSKGNKPHKTLSESLYDLILQGTIAKQNVIEHYINEPEAVFNDHLDEYIIRYSHKKGIDKEEVKRNIKENDLIYLEKKKLGL